MRVDAPAELKYVIKEYFGRKYEIRNNGEIYSLNVNVTKEGAKEPFLPYNLIPVYYIDWAKTTRWNDSTQIKKIFNFYDTEGKKLMWRPNDDTSDIIGAERSEWVDISNIMNTENNKS